MRILLTPLLLGCSFFALNCSEAQSEKRKADTTAKAPAGLTKLATLPRNVPESSGLAHATEAGTYFTHGDNGTDAILYKINRKGELLDRIKVPTRNFDWESLAQDDAGNLYIADCGNNQNQRRNLAINRLSPTAPGQLQTIAFRYEDQEDFPPKKKKRNFDCEATLWHQGKLYLFTRDRGQGQTSNVYELPDQPGTQVARKIASLDLGAEITGADLSPDGKTLALVGKEKLFLFTGGSFSEILKARPSQVSLAGAGQTEGILFTDNQTLLISSEEGNLYEYKL